MFTFTSAYLRQTNRFDLNGLREFQHKCDGPPIDFLTTWLVFLIFFSCSTTLGNLSNSPSACFVASDGESLRVFQAVIDARTLLAEIATSERRHNNNNVMVT